MGHTTALPTCRLEPGAMLAQASPALPGRVRLDAPAVSVMTAGLAMNMAASGLPKVKKTVAPITE